MSTANAVAAVLWLGATFYAVFGGADFGAGFWALFAGRSRRGNRVREVIGWAIGPVWEANHVWLIFVLVVLWTSFPVVFAAIMSTLFIPLSLAALGIVLRGSGFAFQHVASKARNRRVSERFFGVASLLTPFFMGTVVGAIASGRVPPGNAQGNQLTSWLNAVALITGVLFVATSAFLSAVFLVHDSRRFDDPEMESYFKVRALRTAVASGAIATVALFVYRADDRYIYDGLTSRAIPLVIASVLCGLGVVALLLARQATRHAGPRGRRRGDDGLGLGCRPVPVPPTTEPDHLTGSCGQRDAGGGSGRLRDRGARRPSLAGMALRTLAQRDIVEEKSEVTPSR